MTAVSPKMRELVDQVERGLILVPQVTRFFYHAKFPDEFSVSFRKLKSERKPDGWFHPSTHPLMSERKLYYYLAEPDRWEREEIGYNGRMSMLMGSAVHDFVEMCLLDMAILVEPTGACINCERPHGRGEGQCPEHGAIDRELGTRGHMDGVLKLVHEALPDGLGGFEFKTSSQFPLKGVKDHDIEFFRKRWPGYYAQAQEYMRMTGLRYFLVLFLGQGFPWQMREFLILRDEAFMAETAAKYRFVRACVDAGEVPDPCCGVGSAEARACPATSCRIRTMSL